MIGGLGAGGLVLGADGRIGWMQPSPAASSSEEAPYTFLAIAAGGEPGGLRLLQTTTGLPFADAGLNAPILRPDELDWQGAFPSADYRMARDVLPVEARWSFMAPFTPFDVEAATVPGVLLAFQITNHGSRPQEVAAVLNWRHPGGSQGADVQIKPVLDQDARSAGAADDRAESAISGLLFEHGGGQMALCSAPAPGNETSARVWDGADPAELAQFCEDLKAGRELDSRISRRAASACGALCVRCVAAPGETRRIMFTLTWFSAHSRVKGQQVSNYYANRFSDAIDVARHMTRFHRQFWESVNAWQQRLLRSALPRWLRGAMLSSAETFATSAVCDASGRLGFPYGARQGDETSFVASLFFPELESRNLIGRVKHMPFSGRDRDPSRLSEIVLQIYRHYVMTGQRPLLDHAYGYLADAMDGFVSGPDASSLPVSTSTDGITEAADVATLWVAGLRAFARMARRQKDQPRAQSCDRMLAAAREKLSTQLNRLNTAIEQNTTGGVLPKLPGLTWAAMLCLGRLAPDSAVQPVIERIAHAAGDCEEAPAAQGEQVLPAAPGWFGPGPDHAALLCFYGHTGAGQSIYRRWWGRIAGASGADAAVERLAVWKAFYAIQGVFLNALDRTLWIRPNFAESGGDFEAPLFFPACMGWISYQHQASGPFRLAIRLRLDGPLALGAIVLRAPQQLADARVVCRGEQEVEEAAHYFGYDGDERLMEIVLARPVTVGESLTVNVEDAAGH